MKIAKLLKKPFYRTPVEATYVTKLDEKKKKDRYTTNIFVETVTQRNKIMKFDENIF